MDTCNTMWNLSTIIIVCLLICNTKAENEASGSDNGLLVNCKLEILDLTISKQSTDSLKLLLVTGNQNDNYHAYNISRAAAIIKDPFFRKDFRTVIFIHGFSDKPRGPASERIAESYKARGRHNILMLDASSVAYYDYFRASRMSRFVGNRFGRVLAQMVKSGFPLQTLDLIGFSLGAHIAGHTGKSFRKVTGKLMPRIIGLDPSGPCFRKAAPEDRLDKTDAEFVQVIHTNGEELGLYNPVGHVDFYVNGGRRQKSEYGLTCVYVCSHDRVIDIWRATIEYPEAFVGVKCSGVEELRKGECLYSRKKARATMGPAANPKANGVFRLDTANRYPYFYEDETKEYYEHRRWKC